MPDLTITPRTITIAQINHCVSLYSKVIQKHYASKIKDPKKVSEAVQRDNWRYEELPRSLRVKDEQGKPTAMTLEELGRLVQWKM